MYCLNIYGLYENLHDLIKNDFGLEYYINVI
jgi:hypothetical protein